MAQANKMTGGKAMARMLQAFKVGPMFGMGGLQLLAFYDAAASGSSYDHHLIKTSAAARSRPMPTPRCRGGRVGLVDATLGPGDQPRHRPGGGAERRYAGGRLHRRHQSHACGQEHDAGGAAGRDPAPGVQGAAAHLEAARIPELITPRLFRLRPPAGRGPLVVAVPEDVCHGDAPLRRGAFAVDQRRCEGRRRPIRCRPAADDLARGGDCGQAQSGRSCCDGGGVHISQAADDGGARLPTSAGNSPSRTP